MLRQEQQRALVNAWHAMGGVSQTLLPRWRAEGKGRVSVEGESKKGDKDKERFEYCITRT